MFSFTTRLLGVGVLLAASITGSVLSASGASAEGGTRSGSVTPGVSYDPTDQVIVQLAPGRRLDVAAFARAARAGVSVVREDRGQVVLKLPAAQSGAALQATVSAMARVPGVTWAEPDVWMTITGDESSSQWDMRSAGPSVYGIDAAAAWTALPGNAAQTVVAVVDTGYLDHADLTGAFVGDGYDFVSDARIGNDGDGRDGDAHDPGDWITQADTTNRFFRRCTVGNSSWHGTHVAGTVAARHNGDGVNGVDPNARILPVRVLGKCGGYTSDITDGVKWAAGIPVSLAEANLTPASVVNLSLGGSGSCSSTWQTAIDAVVSKGVTVVVAAGNSAANAGNYSPASCNGVITVAATGKGGSRAYYSNYGSTVAIAAPGGDKNADAGDTILSTLNSGATSPASDTYAKYQGTSMASPHVAGVASLVLSVNSGLAPADVLAILQQSVTAFPAGSSCSASSCGAGIVNAAAAVALAAGATPPATTAPTTTSPSGEVPGPFQKLGPTTGTEGLRGGVSLSWSASTGATEYWVCLEQVSTPDGQCSSGFNSGPYSGAGVKFVGLAKGVTYEWDVQARNSVGTVLADAGAWVFTTR